MFGSRIASGKRIPRTTGATVQPFAYDDFSSGDFLSPTGMVWDAGISGSRITATNPPPGKTHSIIRVYGAGDGSNIEFNAAWDAEYRAFVEVWISFMLYLPSNYVHQSATPNNNKLLRVFPYPKASGYESGSKRGASLSNSNITSGEPKLDLEPNIIGFPGNGQAVIDPFLTHCPLASWTQMRFHYKLGSADMVADGINRCWVGSTKVHENLAFKTDVTAGAPDSGAVSPFGAMYLCGAIGSSTPRGFDEETSVQIGDLKFYGQDPGWT